MVRTSLRFAPAALFILSIWAYDARAIPAFARKYETSCLTCHTVYPKLTPFGEGFRRNGYRFPGTDEDVTKQPTIPMGQESNQKTFPKTAWPDWIMNSVPLAVGFNGSGQVLPQFSLSDLTAEGHLWAGGSFTEHTTFFGELTVSPDGAELEFGHVVFADLFFGNHVLDLLAGKSMPTLTSFGPHSTYLGDTQISPLMTTALFGATSDSWNVADTFNNVEVNGVVFGRLDYSLGLSAGFHSATGPTEDWYAHAGYKLGGMRLDGEGGGTKNPARPWEETAVTLDAWLYHSGSTFTNAGGATQYDSTFAYGAQVRAQWLSLELDYGLYAETHTRATAGGAPAVGIAHYGELSYVVYPWLVPALRVEYSGVHGSGLSAYDTRLIPGVAALVLPNLKLVARAQFEVARGAPDAGWGPVGGLAAPASPTETVTAFENLTVGLAYAF